MTKPMSEQRLAEIKETLPIIEVGYPFYGVPEMFSDLIVEIERLRDENGAFRDALEFCRITSTELEIAEQCDEVLETKPDPEEEWDSTLMDSMIAEWKRLGLPKEFLGFKEEENK